VQRSTVPTHGDDVDELVGDDGLATTVVLELERADHVEGVLRALAGVQGGTRNCSERYRAASEYLVKVGRGMWEWATV
jgi:hypothetical protein